MKNTETIATHTIRTLVEEYGNDCHHQRKITPAREKKNVNAQNWEGKNNKSWGKQLFGISVVMLTEAAVEIPPWDGIVIMG